MPVTMPEFRPPEIRPPEELRAPILKSPGTEKTVAPREEGWTPIQNELAGVLSKAFTEGKDSLDSGIHNTMPSAEISKPIDELPPDVKINTESHTISYKGHEFGLPSGLQISGRTIKYTPKEIGRSPASIAASEKGKSPIKTESYVATPPGGGGPTRIPVVLAKNSPNGRGDVTTNAPPPPPPAPPAAAPAAPKVTSQPQTTQPHVESQVSTLRPSVDNRENSVVAVAAGERQAVSTAGFIQRNVEKTQQDTDTAIAQFAGSLNSATTVVGSAKAGDQAKDQQQQERQRANSQAEFEKTIDPTKVSETKAGAGAPGGKK